MSVSGIYRGDDGAALYVQQSGSEVFAFAEHPGKAYALVARGPMAAGRIKLSWWDVPKGNRGQQGSVELEVVQDGQRLQRLDGDSFGARVFERIAPEQVPWPVRKEAGFQASGIGNVTGAYDADDNSRWYIRATAGHTVGVIEAAAQPGERPAFVSVFFGQRVPSTVSDFSGQWTDVPKGLQGQSGNLAASLLKPTTAVWNREMKVEQTGAQRATTLEPDYAVDVEAMGERIEQVMAASGAVGWAYAIATPSGIVKKGAGGNRQLQVDGAQRKFTTRTLAQAGSVSKTATAIALAKALHSRGLPFNTPISFFLPPCWKRGKGIDASLSFGDLASHNTGFEDAGGDDYQRVKKVIENGNLREPSGFQYRNANYTVMRYLVPMLVDKEKVLAIFDKWDCKDSNGKQINQEVSRLFEQIVLQDSFPPSVSSGMAFVPPRGSDFSLNYNWQDPTVAGGPPNPLAAEKAGAGYLALSAESAVMMLRALDDGEIVPVAWARTMKQERYGFDNWYDTKAGRAAWKNGGVSDLATGRALAAWAVVFPGRTYAYLVMNSGRKESPSEDTVNLGAILRSSYDAAFK
jgi:Beta-lactamase